MISIVRKKGENQESKNAKIKRKSGQFYLTPVPMINVRVLAREVLEVMKCVYAFNSTQKEQESRERARRTGALFMPRGARTAPKAPRRVAWGLVGNLCLLKISNLLDLALYLTYVQKLDTKLIYVTHSF